MDIDVTAADIDELTPQVAVARIGLAGPAGTRGGHGRPGAGPGHGGRRGRSGPDGRPGTGPGSQAGSGRRPARPVPRPGAAACRALPGGHAPAADRWQLASNPSDVDDIVQESFLRAFIALDRLRDPDRFASWLAGIVHNVYRGLQRRAPVTLLPDWPEPLHPAAADGLPSAEDLDRADALRAAVADLPVGQRRAVALHYYADLPPGQIAKALRGPGQPAQGPAGARVTGVDIDELGSEVTAARIALTGPAGSRHVPARLADGVAVAITAGAPVRVADTMMDRLAVPLPDDDRTVPLPDPAPALAALGIDHRPRYEPRNLAFADGLDSWLLSGSFAEHASHSHWQDYACTAEGGIAVLSSAVPQPGGFAFLGQEMYADDYRGTVVTFRGEFRGGRVPRRGRRGPRRAVPTGQPGSPGHPGALTSVPPSMTPAIPSSPSRATATGPGTRSRRGCRTTPIPSCSASSWSAAADRAGPRGNRTLKAASGWVRGFVVGDSQPEGCRRVRALATRSRRRPRSR